MFEILVCVTCTNKIKAEKHGLCECDCHVGGKRNKQNVNTIGAPFK